MLTCVHTHNSDIWASIYINIKHTWKHRLYTHRHIHLLGWISLLTSLHLANNSTIWQGISFKRYFNLVLVFSKLILNIYYQLGSHNTVKFWINVLHQRQLANEQRAYDSFWNPYMWEEKALCVFGKYNRTIGLGVRVS